MRTNVVAGTFAALACAVVVSAQAPQAPQTPAPPSQPPAPTQRAPEAKASPANSLTIVGCIERRADSGAPSSVGTSGAAGAAGAASATAGSGFMLTKVTKPTGTAGASADATTPATSYRLDADDSKLSGHVGHKVEIVGSASASSGGETPRLKVESVKMIAANCAE